MKCPSCRDEQLIMSERQGIEIDYCPSCRGVWLDRGELDKIIERTINETATLAQPSRPQPSPQHHYEQPRYSDHGYYKKKKKSSLLSEIFDF